MPLRDIVVLDLKRARAGPTAVRQLADWGARVVKVEMPRTRAGWQQLRRIRFSESASQQTFVDLDLKSPAGREVFLRLAKEADVIIENFRPGVKHRLGIDYETIKAINPESFTAASPALDRRVLQGSRRVRPNRARFGRLNVRDRSARTRSRSRGDSDR